MEILKPADIAAKLNVSTNTLRNYEAKGLVPSPKRTASGYRIYSSVHLIYFSCVKSLSDGFGMDVAVKVMKSIRGMKIDEALWTLNDELIRRGEEKKFVIEAVKLIEYSEKNSCLWSLGEAAERMNVSRTAIRYWDKEGYIRAIRDSDSGYRTFDGLQLAKISLLKAINHRYYTDENARMKDRFEGTEGAEACRKLASEVLTLLGIRNRRQLKAMAYVEKLLEVIEFE
ncbi:MerR family DNA-binding transcriptional regulator [Alkalihalophilus pseudofirmus]|uniref:MerR family DNA-binding transcriptional regulator n=1 Tax=Alkalihalophilus pseudofirmus TaxID=79885 RepID=UPI00259B865A|nr:MerR family DNA-binding transcriptional regulator [Alkalihalophilus pseudofirmus]WEG17340.1 MerR family DNA-binding transcriptional regulator [Alkalihalophilus pseudofirmus]